MVESAVLMNLATVSIMVITGLYLLLSSSTLLTAAIARDGAARKAMGMDEGEVARTIAMVRSWIDGPRLPATLLSCGLLVVSMVMLFAGHSGAALALAAALAIDSVLHLTWPMRRSYLARMGPRERQAEIAMSVALIAALGLHAALLMAG
jgi:hypothetical protein